MLNRRDFLRTAALGTGALAFTHCAVLTRRAGSTGWDQVPDILARIRPPTFADRDFAITSYGAQADGRTDCSTAFRRAIAACSQAGGGRVVVPAGRFLTGPIHLLSNVNLHVQGEGTIAFDTDPA